MDGLALLCALHADGPQSLRRLRRSGCPSLEAVTTLEVERLAELLTSSPSAAQRFQREAHHLLARLGGTSARDLAASADDALLEPEEVEAEARAAVGAQSVDTTIPPSIVPSATLPIANVPRADAPGSQAAQNAYDAVLDRWRALDALEDARSVAEPIVEESSAPAPHTSPRTPLSVLQDLADESRDAMFAVGIVDLEGLAACDALELSKATGLDYSNAVRWRSLARRALPTGTERFSRSGLPVHTREPIVALDEYVMRPTARIDVPRADATLRGESVLRTDSEFAPREETAGGPFA